MNGSIKWITILILAAVCGTFYLLTFGLFKQERQLYFGIAVHDLPRSENLQQLSQNLKFQPQIFVFALPWSNDLPIDTLNSLWKTGMVPSITWETNALDQIKNGRFDTYLKKMANGFNKLEFPVIIRFTPDMNHKMSLNSSSPSLYKETYQYIINFFRQHQVKNILWAFTPYATSLPQVNWNTISNYYPGNDYIDIVGMDGYNIKQESQKWNALWQGFNIIFEPLYRELKALAPSKPLMVFTAMELQKDQDQKAWILGALETCKAWNISALIWTNISGENNWLVSDLDEKLRRYFTQNPSAQQWAQSLQKSKN